MRINKALASVGLLTTALLTLTACGNQNSQNENNTNTAKKFLDHTAFKAVKKGGTLNYAIEADSPFSGVFDTLLTFDASDTEVMQFGEEGLFDTDSQYKINNKGPATFKLNQKAKTVTITIKKGVKWSDGHQVNAKDLEYAYEVIANKGTASRQYSFELEDIKGMAAYHQGKAKSISGITMPDGPNGRTIVLHYKEMKAGMQQDGSEYLLDYAEPYHYLKNVPFKKLISSDQIRKKPLFFGPYQVSKVVRGQSVTWVPNKYYWRGKPKLNKIVASVVSSNNASEAIKKRKFDITGVINSQWEDVKNTPHTSFVAKIPLSYFYLGFRVGKWEHGKNVMDKHSLVGNRSLRQAMAYAMNIEQVEKRYTHGLSFRVPTLIPAQFGDFFNKKDKGFPYNMKKANELLNKAGYKKKGKWRVQPNGKPLHLQLAAVAGGKLQEPIVQNWIQQWRKLGLNVTLTQGRLIEYNSYYEKLGSNNTNDINVFLAGWDLDTEPSPASLYGENSQLNYSHFATKKNNQLLKEIDSSKSFNHDYRVKAFHKWQSYMNKEAYVVPMTNSYSIQALNSKLVNYSLNPAQDNNGYPLWYKVGFEK